MTDKNLRDLLEGLHDELQHVESVDEKGRALLRDLDTDIRSLLERSSEEDLRVDESILESFQSAVEHFEITHPTLTMALSEMITALSNAGI
jgi:predicted component of type VI protein secretion system